MEKTQEHQHRPTPTVNAVWRNTQPLLDPYFRC